MRVSPERTGVDVYGTEGAVRIYGRRCRNGRENFLVEIDGEMEWVMAHEIPVMPLRTDRVRYADDDRDDSESRLSAAEEEQSDHPVPEERRTLEAPIDLETNEEQIDKIQEIVGAKRIGNVLFFVCKCQNGQLKDMEAASAMQFCTSLVIKYLENALQLETPKHGAKR